MASSPVIKDNLRCRDIGHHWEEVVMSTRRDPEWGRRRELYCGYCGTIRLELINYYGEVGSRSYLYDDDYKTVSKVPRKEARAKRAYRRRRRGKE